MNKIEGRRIHSVGENYLELDDGKRIYVTKKELKEVQE